jgi:agmatinase
VAQQFDRSADSQGNAGSAGTSPPVAPLDATRIPRFAGLATFARLPRLQDVDRADIAVAGVPFDAGTSFSIVRRSLTPVS